MNSIAYTNSKNYINIRNSKQYFSSMTIGERARKLNLKYFSKYKYLEAKNKHRKTMLITFTTNSNDLNMIKQIKNKFLTYLKTDKNLKSSYAYIWVIELGKNFDNPHLHIMIWYDDSIKDRIEIHYNKTINCFGLVKKRSKLISNYDRAAPYVLKEFNIINKDFVNYHMSRKKISLSQNKKNLRFIGFSSFEHSEKIYKKSYILYSFNYLQTDKYINYGHLIVWDNRYLVIRNKLNRYILYFLLNNKIINNNNFTEIDNNKIYFTVIVYINKGIYIVRSLEFPHCFQFY